MHIPDRNPADLVEFRCATCGIPLTEPLRELTNVELLCDDDAQPVVPQGYYFSEDNYVIINVRDRLNVRRVKDEERLGGCCGMDGMDGPNTECINGHEVATEVTDCWLPHALTFVPAAVTRHAAPSGEDPPTPAGRAAAHARGRAGRIVPFGRR